MTFHVKILIVSYHSAKDIRRCLEALETSTWTDFGVVICENGGQDAFAELAALPVVLKGGQAVERVLAPGNLGYAGGVNFAMASAAGADAYWVLNPDTQPAPDALAALVVRLRQGDCTAVGHDLLQENGRLSSVGGRWTPWMARAISLGHNETRSPHRDRAQVEAEANYINGASMLIGRAFVERVGVMREDYFLYCEEVEWCLRGLKAGEKLGYAEDAVVVHIQGTSTGGGGFARTRSRTSVYLTERNRLLLTRDMFPARLPISAIMALAHLLARYGRARAWPQVGFALSGWLAGLRDERGVPRWLQGTSGSV